MAWLPALGLALLMATPPQDSPRLRTLLANGTAILVERFAGAKVMTVQVFAGARGVQETPETHGHRHLLEHLILRGKRGDLDRRLERLGIFFTGRTHRDALQLEFIGRPTQLDAMLSAVQELLEPPSFDEATVTRELAVMREEFALVPDHQRLSRTAWQTAYGVSGLDPFGTEESIARATPAGLRGLHASMFHPGNVVVVIAGDVEIQATTAKVRPFVEDRESDVELPAMPTREGKGSREEAPDAFGEARGAIVNGLGDSTAATLCAAYGIAAWVENAYVTYTPSATGGLVIVGRTDANNALGSVIEELTEGDEALMFAPAKELAKGWLREQLASPTSAASLRGLLMVQSAGLRPETLFEAVDRVGWTEFRQAIARFKQNQAAIAVGTRR